MVDIDVDEPRHRFMKADVHGPGMAVDMSGNRADELGVAVRMK